VILGVDPGLSGALAFLNGKALIIHDMPTLKAGTGSKRIVDEDELARIIDDMNGPGMVSHAYIEKVGAMPGQGVTSMFSFGTSYGLVRMAVAANFIPRTYPTPKEWKKALGVPASKDGARLRASQLMPQHAHMWQRAKDDGRAEAALIAYYGAHHGS
jgi:crossover junction endodeoxyribonuclease RuvC